MSEVLEINDPEQLPQIQLAWNALLPGTPAASFFHTYDWLNVYWRHFGAAQKLRVLVVRSGGSTVGILPLCVRKERYRLGSLRVLTYPLDNWGTWYGPIGPSPAATMLAAMQHIRRTPHDWDMIDFRWIGPEDLERGRTARALRAANLFSQRQPFQSTSVADLPASWDEFVAEKSPALGRQLQCTLRQVFENRDAEFVRHRPAPARDGDGDPAWDLYATCEAFALVKGRSAAANGISREHDRVRDYCRAAHAAAARLGMVDLNLLFFAGRPAAFLYSFHYQGRITALWTGSDPAAGRDDIGMALILASLRDAIGRRDRLIDFGPGETEVKRQLRTRWESTYRLTYAPFGSFRSQRVRFGRWFASLWQRKESAPASPIA
jgi:CelD/BcsL family acetyltransferase involved in cellulose biosynthesis